MIAHRGLSGLEKENTNLAFVAAGNRSYYGIETDIHRTSDGKFIVIHDHNTDRLAGMHCVIEETDLAILRRIILKDTDGSTGRVDLHLPTMEEYVSVCKKYEKVSILELKGPFSGEDADHVIDILREADHLRNTIFISFEPQNLILLRERLPDHPIQLLFSEWKPEPLELMDRYRFDADICYPALNRERVAQLHDAGHLVNCWTVDDPGAAENLVDWGVDFITTNILEGR